jgi:HD-like signal output (HDOD) protein/CheY-like chemotaxis protein
MVNILFVDDELFILQSVKRTIRGKDKNIYLASSGAEGLKILETSPIDIVVSDVRMPAMDGIEFLKEVRKLYPHVYRLILSGYVDREVVLKAILTGVAFEYLTKPWEKDALRAKLNHIVDIRTKLSNENIINLINRISHLPRDNEKIHLIEKAIDEDETIENITKLVSEDLSITTKILQMVNSALYTNEKISSLKEAIEILGLSSIRSLIIASMFIMDEEQLSNWQKNKVESLIDEQCKVNANFSTLYYQKMGHPVPNECSTLGLVYNIGKILNVSYFPDRYLKIKDKIDQDKLSYYEAEIALGHKGETHQEIGAYFLELWNFSRINIEATLFHHNPEMASTEFRETLMLLKEAREMVKRDSNQ